ncbi:MFS transporter [Gracilibacillus caseinilyticus]|uniref:MFS transporter n=1 Tax=Gracilibacillus caseinilyticus TaxID=2932256 RepID=A0ABY4ET30_9BACI|nr:MFS transporter [Gracilibacillus caseinilyticus]UOQ47028.1 MFS transporter [Gracilibacillus caseinilyticus]
MTENKIWTKDFISLAIVNLFVFMSFYTLLTTLPLFVMNEWNGSEAEGGMVVTAMLLAAILLRPFSGTILSKYGKTKVLLISNICFAVTMVVYIWVDSYYALLLLRFIHGFSFAIVTTATSALAADIVPAAKRGEGLGYFTMSMNLAIVLGPFFGLSFIQITSYNNLFIILSIFSILSVLSTFLLKVEDPPEQEITPFNWRELLERPVLPIAAIGLLISFAYASIVSFISVFASARGLDQVSSYFFAVFAITMLSTRPFLGKQFDLRGPRAVIIPCMLLFAAGFVLLSLSQNAFTFLLAAGIIGIGYGSLLPFFLSISVSKVSLSRSGHATATFLTLYDAGIAIGSSVLGIVASMLGFTQMFILLAVFVCLIIWIFSVYMTRSTKKITE